jgi:hypothetical protein
MSYTSDIANAIRAIALRGQLPGSREGTVTGVDRETMTCSVRLVGEELVLPNVAYRGVAGAGNGLGVLLVPELDSDVRVGFGEGGMEEAYVAEFGALAEVAVYVGDALVLRATSDGKLTLGKNDALGGLVKLLPLVQKLNGLEQQVAALTTAFNTHTHTYVNVATPAVTATALPQGDAFNQTTNRGDLENTGVQHG